VIIKPNRTYLGNSGLVHEQQLRILHTMIKVFKTNYFRSWWLATSLLAVLMVTACTRQVLDTSNVPVGETADAGQSVAPESEVKDLREPTSEEVMYHVFAAEFLGSEGDLEAAVGEYLEAALESSDAEIARRATRVAFAAQAWLQAAMAADRWAFLDPENVEAHKSAATAMLLTGDYAGAELQLQQIIQLMGNTTEAWILVSSLLARSADTERVSVLLGNVLASQGAVNNADAMFAQSHLAARSRDLIGAYELAEQAVELEPERIEFLTWAGRLALNLNKIGAGLQYVERAWKQDPGEHDLALAYADLLSRTHRVVEARKVMENMQQTPDVMLARIVFEINAQDRDRAEKLFRQFDSAGFDDPHETAFYQAQAAEALDMIPRAIELYGKVETGDKALFAGIRRAELMAGEGDVEGARRELAGLRLQNSQSQLIVEESWLAEARILRETGDGKTALAALDKALERLPGSISIRYSHALLAAELGWVDVAEKDLRIIISEQPENAAALNALGYTLADQTERYEEAEALIRQAFILRPNDASIVDSMGWISYRLGHLDESEKFLRRAWALDRNPEISAHLGEVLWVIGKQEAARSIWREGMEADGENPVLKETLQRMEVDL
jgi:tetratricopeptide (TPR) repeat protein